MAAFFVSILHASLRPSARAKGRDRLTRVKNSGSPKCTLRVCSERNFCQSTDIVQVDVRQDTLIKGKRCPVSSLFIYFYLFIYFGTFVMKSNSLIKSNPIQNLFPPFSFCFSRAAKLMDTHHMSTASNVHVPSHTKRTGSGSAFVQSTGLYKAPGSVCAGSAHTQFEHDGVNSTQA